MPILALALVALLFAASCDGNDTPMSGESPPLAVDDCSLPFEPAFGWKAEGSNEAEQGAHVGRQEIISRDGKVLVYSAGMLRDQFETAPMKEGLTLTDGGDAYLFAITEPVGSEGYTLFWYGPEPCKQYAIDGVEGFARPGEFLETMREVGVLEP
jgi:hypothetical protein